MQGFSSARKDYYVLREGFRAIDSFGVAGWYAYGCRFTHAEQWIFSRKAWEGLPKRVKAPYVKRIFISVV